MGKTFKDQTVSGIKWNLLNQVITQVVNLGISVLLMRLILPKEFGLLGMVVFFTGILNVLSDFGLSSSLIYKKDTDDLDKHTLFWTNLALGVFLTLLLSSCSHLIANFYDEPRLVNITILLSLTFSIQALGGVQQSLFKKDLNFKNLFIVNTSAIVISGSCAIYMAYHDFGIWALISQQLITVLISTISIWIMSDYRPTMAFSLEKLKIHLNYGVSLFGNNIFSYLSRNADNFLIGKLLGAEPLGFYSKAYSLMMLPVSRLSGVIGTVLFPSFSRIQDEKDRIRHIYLKINRVVAFITFPLMGMLFVVADPFVRIVFGENWVPMISVLKVFSIIGALQSIGTFVGTIFLSQGATKLFFKINLFTGILVILSFVIGVQYSIAAVANCYMVAVLLVTVPQYHFAGRLINSSAWEIIKNILPHLFIAIFIVLTVNLSYHLIQSDNLYLNLSVGIIQFSVLWIALNYLFNRKSYDEFLKTIKEI